MVDAGEGWEKEWLFEMEEGKEIDRYMVKEAIGFFNLKRGSVFALTFYIFVVLLPPPSMP